MFGLGVILVGWLGWFWFVFFFVEMKQDVLVDPRWSVLVSLSLGHFLLTLLSADRTLLLESSTAGDLLITGL